jgi:hypothetical protein
LFCHGLYGDFSCRDLKCVETCEACLPVVDDGA